MHDEALQQGEERSSPFFVRRFTGSTAVQGTGNVPIMNLVDMLPFRDTIK
jgi:hypothetical protein